MDVHGEYVIGVERTLEADIRLGFYLSYIKPVFDYVLAILLIPIALPIVLIAAVAIKLDSPGPASFWQRRVGRNGKPFWMAKLRTMHEVDSDPKRNNLHPDPSKITRVGRFLRKHRIDEFAQITNVLWGQMYLIAPRADTVGMTHEHLARDPDYARRLCIKPGITGLSQVLVGRARNANELKRTLATDLEYIERASLWLDLTIALRTVRVIWNKFGAE